MGLTAKRSPDRRRSGIRPRNQTCRKRRTIFLKAQYLATARRALYDLGDDRAGVVGRGLGRMRTHVDERTIVDAVGDNANTPVRDSSDLRLLLLWTGRINYARL